MISGQNYKEFIEEQGQIEKNIAQGWGYQLKSNEYVPKREKVTTNLKVACIQPLRHIFDVPVSKKLQKVQQELLMLQNERKLNQMTQKAFEAKTKGQIVTEQESAAIRMMHQCVEEYNFIVNHRHIVQKNSQKARKILGIQKSQSKELFQQINSLKQQIGRSTLTKTIKINSQIAKLYKRFSRIVPKSMNNSQRFTSHNRSIINRTNTSVNNSTTYVPTSKYSPNKLSTNLKDSQIKQTQNKDSRLKKQSNVQIKDLMIMQELNESQQGDSMASSRLIEQQLKLQPQSMLINHGFGKMKRRISQHAPRKRLITAIDVKQTQKMQKKCRMTTTIQQAYEKKQVINKGKKLDKIIQEHHDVIDVWKQRINENKQKNQKFHLKFQPEVNVKRFQSLKNTKRNLQGQAQIRVNNQNRLSIKKVDHRAQELKQNLAQRQKIISLILRKKQSKYKRIPGTQIMQKNDVNQTAKILLGISKNNQNQQNNKNSPKKIVKVIQQDKPEWQNLQQNDEKLYWSMCKNEKMNILLKSRKQQ